jgi:bifunctional DNA-binding transcriptional regulator/antitoxin component of YhaV-PrlF toxin-antitoxin module
MTVTVKNKTPLVVPPAVRRLAGLKSGDELEFKVSGQVIHHSSETVDCGRRIHAR